MRREIWLYERIDLDGTVGNHLYVVLSNEHPLPNEADNIAEFVEDVYTENRVWVKVGQQEVFHKIATDQYRYINFSKSALEQEWERPVFANRKGSSAKPNFVWTCFRKQLEQVLKTNFGRKIKV